jgi:poly-gamma-glutamate capsule biosynthesis protein CapA/YwtB (metallophosphatase superfamily)
VKSHTYVAFVALVVAASALVIVRAVAQVPDAIGARLDVDPRAQIPKELAPATIRDGFTFAAVGDLLGPQRTYYALRRSEFEPVADILQRANVAFANLEGSILDLTTFQGYPAAQNGGGNPVAAPQVAEDLRAMGIDVLSRANNHAGDWGAEGIFETTRWLDKARLVHAGSGRTRAAARMPAYLETASGRVALVAAASTFTPNSMAGPAAGEVLGRPGISVLRTRRVLLVTEEEMRTVRAVAKRHGSRVQPDGRELSLFGELYRVSTEPGLTYEMNRFDHYEILQSVRAAKQTSDLTVFSIHAHESLSGEGDDARPATFQPALFHDVIDAGADIVVVHGPHILRGIEIYKGRPIFYGLASLFFALEHGRAAAPETFEGMGLDARSVTYSEYLHKRFFEVVPASWFDSVIAVTKFERGQAKEIRLYPLDLGYSRTPRLTHRGTPQIAAPAVARRILDRMRDLSLVYGTQIRNENDVGIVDVPRYAP